MSSRNSNPAAAADCFFFESKQLNESLQKGGLGDFGRLNDEEGDEIGICSPLLLC